MIDANSTKFIVGRVIGAYKLYPEIFKLSYSEAVLESESRYVLSNL